MGVSSLQRTNKTERSDIYGTQRSSEQAHAEGDYGVGADGKNLYKNRTIAGLAPVLTDADALAVGRGFANLQKHGLDQVMRTDTAVLTD